MLHTKHQLRQACLLAINDPKANYGVFLDRQQKGKYAALLWARPAKMILAEIVDTHAKNLEVYLTKLTVCSQNTVN